MKYRFREDKILKEVSDYIAGTYKAHYVNEKAGTKDEEIQTIDVWKQIGHVEEACHSNIIKYSALGLIVSFFATGFINMKANMNKKTNPIRRLNNKSINPKDDLYLGSFMVVIL